MVKNMGPSVLQERVLNFNSLLLFSHGFVINSHLVGIKSEQNFCIITIISILGAFPLMLTLL